MKILFVHRFFNIQGGGERYFFNLSRYLIKMGHKIAYFSMKDNKNERSYWSKFFVSNVNISARGFISRLRLVGRLLYSFEAKRKLSKLLHEFQPDIVHIHNLNV